MFKCFPGKHPDQYLLVRSGLHCSTHSVHQGQTSLLNGTRRGTKHLRRLFCETLTALLGALVVADEGLLVGRAEESGPVDGAVVAELAVLGDVDVAGADLPQGLELQRGDALLLQDQQRDSTERGSNRWR